MDPTTEACGEHDRPTTIVAVDAKGGRIPTGIWRSESGQDLAEYAILVSLIALVVVGAVTLFGQALVAAFNTIVAQLPFGGS